MLVREKSDSDMSWTRALLQAHWGGTVVVAHGEAIDAMGLPALVAGDQRGIATYRVHGDEAELVTIDAVESGQGIGTHLVSALAKQTLKLRFCFAVRAI